MRLKIFTHTFTLALAASFTMLQAQTGLFIDTSYSAEQMVMDFFENSCVTPSNITFNGSPASMAYFEGANTDLGVNAGIVLTTGDVGDLAGPASSFATSSMGTDGDAELEALVGFPTYDAAVLEFDLLVEGDGDLDFEYVFGSEEYPEFVGSAFNDVFGFFIGTDNPANIALLPGANIPVAINNVNEMTNQQYYLANDVNGGQYIVFDGLTTPLPATFMATGGNTYHVKIAVGDVSDGVFDSGVFIGIESLCGDSLLTPPAEFLLSQNGNTVTFENQSRYATSWLWDFGDNTTSDERFPGPHTYAEDGVYTVTLTTQNWCCSETFETVVTVGNPNGTEEAARQQFELFPNPATEVVTIQVFVGQTFDFELVDLAGKILRSGTAVDGSRLNVSELTPGSYFLKMKNEAGFFVKKLTVR